MPSSFSVIPRGWIFLSLAVAVRLDSTLLSLTEQGWGVSLLSVTSNAVLGKGLQAGYV